MPIDLRKKVTLRNGGKVEKLVSHPNPGSQSPYTISGRAQIISGWEYCSWTEDGHFCTGDDDDDEPNEWDLVEVGT